MNTRLVVLSLCAATTACAENLPPVQNTGMYPDPIPARPPQPTPSISTVSQMMTRIDQMQREIQQLTGKVEEQAFQIQELKKQQKTMYSDFDERVQALETKGTATASTGDTPLTPEATTPSTEIHESDTSTTDVGSAAAGSAVGADVAAGTTASSDQPSDSPTIEPSTATPKPKATTETNKPTSAEPPIEASADEKQEYQAAYTQLSIGQTDEAIAAFNNYLVKYPTGGYASNAQYWLGEAYRVKQDDEAAKAAFNKVVNNYPTSPKVPDAMLKLAYIEIDHNNKDQARNYLTRIKAEYPNSNAAYLAGKRLASLDSAP